MDYPEDCIAKGAKREVRVLEAIGTDFAIYRYMDAGTGKTGAKYSILLRRGGGETEHLYVVPAGRGKELIVKHEMEKGAPRRGIFDRKSGKAVYL